MHSGNSGQQSNLLASERTFGIFIHLVDGMLACKGSLSDSKKVTLKRLDNQFHWNLCSFDPPIFCVNDPDLGTCKDVQKTTVDISYPLFTPN